MSRSVILLVEDEADLLQVITTAVSRALPEYDVLAAATVAEAEAHLAEVEASGRSLAVAIVDHLLGGGWTEDASSSGLALVEAVRRRFPGARTFLFTGQANHLIERRAQQSGARVLWKPLRLKTLLGEVEDALRAVS